MSIKCVGIDVHVDCCCRLEEAKASAEARIRKVAAQSTSELVPALSPRVHAWVEHEGTMAGSTEVSPVKSLHESEDSADVELENHCSNHHLVKTNSPVIQVNSVPCQDIRSSHDVFFFHSKGLQSQASSEDNVCEDMDGIKLPQDWVAGGSSIQGRVQ